MELHYPDWLWRNETSRNHGTPEKLNTAFATLQRWYPQPGRLLDVGCGPGDFVLLAQKAGWHARGIEVSNTQVEYARSHGADVTLVPDFTAYQCEETYDVITFNHVLEHVPEPKAYLMRAIHLLGPQGILLIAVPNYGGVSRRIFQQYWTHLDLPRHIFHYNPTNLTRMLRQLGCDVLQVSYHDPQQNSLGVRDSLRRWIGYGILGRHPNPTGPRTPEIARGPQGLRRMPIYLYRGFGGMLSKLTEWLRCADTFTVIARSARSQKS
jgi:SAM-dependent methyltransferase